MAVCFSSIFISKLDGPSGKSMIVVELIINDLFVNGKVNDFE